MWRSGFCGVFVYDESVSAAYGYTNAQCINHSITYSNTN
jgi:hypothetical protein